ncbi:hypothetical protein HDU93_007290 [Gonapodya sp. JEL0774]|nr:hypothetical protein HDU93_007290 [Gonapodya sp. JEL0774]
MMTALTTLYKEGGFLRFYRGYLPALIQGPVSRFGDTAANAGALAFLESNETAKNWPVALKTVFASAFAASFRILLLPVDTVKTTMQVVGADGLKVLRTKIATNGPQVLWYGAIAASAATFVGHYPWSFSPRYKDSTPKRLARNAGIGFVASVASDTISNSIRVVKTYKQANPEKASTRNHLASISYSAAVRDVVAKDGWVGLFGRGLSTRIVANGMQGLMFSVLWKYFQDIMAKRGY